MIKILNIIEGIKNNIFKKEDIELIANERLSICFDCPHIDLTGDKCLVPLTQPCCSKCGCKLSWKSRALSEQCGDDDNPRWKAVMSEDEENELKEKLNIKD